MKGIVCATLFTDRSIIFEEFILKLNLAIRYLVFLVSIFIISLGISIFAYLDLGISPISSAAYVFSLNTPFSLGVYMIVLGLILIVVQSLMLGLSGIREKWKTLLLQFPIAFLFGFFVDISMWLFRDFSPDGYIFKLMWLVFGCLILALGISIEVIADVAMMGGEYTLQIAAKRFKKEFGSVKLIFDITLVAVAAISSWCFSQSFQGIREGTIIAALITGPFVRFLMPYLGFVRKIVSFSSDRDNDSDCDVSLPVFD